MRIDQFFQKGYYINLDRRTDRRVEFENEMDKYGYKDFFERVSAEDAINEPDHIKKHYYCAQSFFNLFKKIYDNGHENVVIFEDDAYFYDGGNIPGHELVTKALDELQNFPDWEMIYFGGHPIREVDVVSETLYHAPTVLTLHAVGYKRSAIKEILDQLQAYTQTKFGTAKICWIHSGTLAPGGSYNLHKDEHCLGRYHIVETTTPYSYMMIEEEYEIKTVHLPADCRVWFLNTNVNHTALNLAPENTFEKLRTHLILSIYEQHV